jgi:hypothetical protein
MRTKDAEMWLAMWFNQYASVVPRIERDASIVLAAFNLTKLAEDLVKQIEKDRSQERELFSAAPWARPE